ncbi:Ig-like domain-containing protein [Anaerocolumna chitinilytica]|uniref:BIG2 domain-containing protein n=1 Tax=Anaerocolumna chitinilytica TaxID=1727145 RepID=A0A7I8DKY8_9FIRM|nr:Ig-like domain-containing protein [Anaerocolumna chitinilytica]BCJ99039.1 hypothetical protein bsdcttw_20800 [Anaerocolumna chitinilytica]
MKKLKGFLSAILFLLLITMYGSFLFPGINAVAEAATIKISHTEISLPVNSTKTIAITGTSKKVTWSSGNSKVATVNSNGLITAKSEGTTTITAYVSGKKLNCKVNSYIPMSISSKAFNLNTKKNCSLEVIGTTKKPTWSSSNVKIATVSKYGTVTGVSKGSAIITAMVGNKKFSSKVTVLEPITINTKTITLTEGQNYNLKINGISYRAVWSTSNSSIAAVSIYGTVTALKEGKVTITAFVDGEKLNCVITVKKPTGISEYSFLLKAGESSVLTPAVITVTPTLTPTATPTETPDVTVTPTDTHDVTVTPTETPDVTVTPSADNSEITMSLSDTSSEASPTPEAIQWNSSNPQVASVSENGEVKGIKPGTAIITATYNNQTFTYQAIVLSQYNPYIGKAPFSVKQETYENISYLLPSNWEIETDQTVNGEASMAYNATDSSNIIITFEKNSTYAPNYFSAKKELKGVYSLNSVKLMYDSIFKDTGISYSIKNYVQSDYQSDNGPVLKTQYTATIDGQKITQTIYDLYLGKYSIEIVVSDNSKGSTIQKMGEFILNSITMKN